MPNLKIYAVGTLIRFEYDVPNPAPTEYVPELLTYGHYFDAGASKEVIVIYLLQVVNDNITNQTIFASFFDEITDSSGTPYNIVDYTVVLGVLQSLGITIASEPATEGTLLDIKAAIGGPTDTYANDYTGSWSLTALLKGLWYLIYNIGIYIYQTGAAVVNPKGWLMMGYDGTNIRAIKTDSNGAIETNATATVAFNQEDTSYPVAGSVVGTTNANVDVYGNLRTRGTVLTDEQSIRDDFSGVALGADWTQTLVNGTITVANSILEITSSTLVEENRINQDVDYCPITLRCKMKLAGRYANQVFRLGFIYRNAGVITEGAWLEFSGTTNTLVNTVSCSSADSTDIEQYTNQIIPLSLTTANYIYWKIDVSNNTVTFSASDDGLNFEFVTQHKLHIPSPYQGLPIEIGFKNTVVTTNNTAFVDMIFANNMNRLQIDQDFGFEPMPAQLLGRTDSGQALQIPVTSEGHMEVSIHDPLTVFGEVSVAMDTPVFQSDFVYGINAQQVLAVVSGSGATTTTEGLAQISTGATIYSYAVLESRKRLRYRPGQGVKVFFTALYTSPVANSYQGVGCGTAENGLYFGYGNTSNLSDLRFGAIYIKGGKREVKTLTLTTRATSAGNVTITLNAVATVVALTNSTLQQNVWELSKAIYVGWDAYPNGATVVFIRKSSGATAGTQTYAAGTTGSAATIVQTRAGVASTDTFIGQNEWNVDRCDGSGDRNNPSGFNLNPQKINLFRLKIGYLGAHDLIFQIKITPPNSNNSVWNTVHIIRYANLNTQVSFTNASFPFNSFAYSAGSTTNLTVSMGSFAGVIEGKKYLIGPRATYFNSLTTVGASNFQAFFTVYNPRVFAGVANQTVINVQSFSGALKHTSPAIYYIIKNGNLAGSPSFAAYSASTCGLWDTAATTVTYATNDQLLYTFHLGDTGEIDHHFTIGELNGDEFTIQPGEWITVAAKAVTGTPSYMTASINTREDQ